jgi:hypothetical protein
VALGRAAYAGAMHVSRASADLDPLAAPLLLAQDLSAAHCAAVRRALAAFAARAPATAAAAARRLALHRLRDAILSSPDDGGTGMYTVTVTARAYASAHACKALLQTATPQALAQYERDAPGDARLVVAAAWLADRARRDVTVAPLAEEWAARSARHDAAVLGPRATRDRAVLLGLFAAAERALQPDAAAMPLSALPAPPPVLSPSPYTNEPAGGPLVAVSFDEVEGDPARWA